MTGDTGDDPGDGPHDNGDERSPDTGDGDGGERIPNAEDRDDTDDSPGHRGPARNTGDATVDSDRVDALSDELAEVRDDLEALESRVENKTVHRDDITAELRRYVRARQRRGHATGWGPYIVLLYGTGMTLGAFYYLGGPAAIAAMIVIWLSTLGLYVVMLGVGGVLGAIRKVGGIRDLIGKLR